jgi:nucleoredoxin
MASFHSNNDSLLNDGPPNILTLLSENLASDLFIDPTQQSHSTQSCTQNKILGLYFSAHWCPPCRKFTPLLAQRYLEIQSTDPLTFEIIFVSSDPTEEASLEYFSDMPWKMLRYSERALKDKLGELYHISGIPSLLLFDEEGNLLTRDGRSVIFLPPAQWKTYELEKAEAERALNEKMLALPETVTHAAHPHPLIKTKDPYGAKMNYGCDICSMAGSHWAYHCSSCHWDAHPACVCEELLSPSLST